MNTLTLQSYLVAAATVFCPLFVLSVPLNSDGGNLKQFTLIGTIEGKSYFAEENATMSWIDANTFCQASGLHLATISSVAEATLLKKAYNNVSFFDQHWTAGRDTGTPTQFSWQDNNETLSASVLSPFSNGYPVNCMTFHPDDESFHGYPCDRIFKVLCELAP